LLKYSEAVDYLDGKVVLGVKPSLARIKAVCELLGNPEGSFDSIQLTGTNGKTSVAFMVASILGECGYRTGLYTSPHLETVRERIAVSGRLISVTEFTDVLSRLKSEVERAQEEAGEPLTYFEVVTAAAFLYFKEREVDIAVLEVGMGGRWDATNVVDSEVAVITNIGIDHVNELGRTREKIASEKVGIINEGAVVVTTEADREMLLLISDRCDRVGAEMRVFGGDFRLDYTVPYRVPGEEPAQYIGISGLDGRDFSDIKIPMLGKHQAVNASCAVAAAQGYTDPRERTDVARYKKALQEVRIPGRLEVMSRCPLVLADGAHNVSGVERLVSAVTGEFDYERLAFVVAIMEDKDARGILRLLGAAADEVIATENRSSRSVSAGKLGAYCRMERLNHQVEPDFAAAMRLAYNSAGSGGIVCVTGSLYTVSEARIFFRHQRASREMRQDR
jgi:dihydrofolate synthase / folylpolyglutamate synthase